MSKVWAAMLVGSVRLKCLLQGQQFLAIR